MNTAALLEALASLETIARQLTTEPKGSAQAAALYLETCETVAQLADELLTDEPNPRAAVAVLHEEQWAQVRR